MLLMDDIIKEGHPTLVKKARDVILPLSNNDKKTLELMMEFLKNSQNKTIAEKYNLRAGVGIAAPQINVSKRMFAIYFHDLDGILYEYTIINPILTITNFDIIYIPQGEGCLSVDRETQGLTPRYKSINIKALNYDVISKNVIPIELNLTGYPAIVFQHEYDHIEGVLFVEKLFEKLQNGKPAFEVVNLPD